MQALGISTSNIRSDIEALWDQHDRRGKKINQTQDLRPNDFTSSSASNADKTHQKH